MYHILRYFALLPTSTSYRVIKQVLRHMLPFCVAVALLAYALKGVSFTDLIQQFRQAHYGWIALSGLMSVLMYMVRGKRWQQALLALGHYPSAFRAALALQSGTIASMVVFGSGEITRCATLQRTDNIPFSHSIGSVIAERIIDLLVLGLLLLLTFTLEIDRMRIYLSGLTLASARLANPYLLVGMLVLFVALGWIGWRVLQHHSIRQRPLVRKAFTFAGGIWQGIGAIRQLPHPWFFVFLTILYQAIAWLGVYWLLMALDMTRDLPLTAALTIVTVSSLGGLAVPTQGGIGTYHFLVSRALVLYGFTAGQGAIIATFLHAVGFGVNLLLSSVSFLILPAIIQRRQAQMNGEALKKSAVG